MTGSLQIKKGHYYIVLNLKNSGGQSKKKWVSTGLSERNNKRKAEQMLREAIKQSEEAHTVFTKSISFSKFITDWLSVIKTQVKANTYYQYESIVKNSIVPYFNSGVTLQELTPVHIQKYYSFKIKGGAGANTVKRHHANIHKALSYAVKLNMIPYNPADRVELPKKEKFVGKFLEEDQLKILLGSIRGNAIEAPVIFAAFYGLRRSEALGLKWSAVDFKLKTITISHTVVNNGGQVMCSDTTKNSSSRRTLPLLPYVEEFLIDLKTRQRDMRRLFGNTYVKSDYVCTMENGKLLYPDYVTKMFNKILQQNNIPKIRFHDLRHSSASLLIQKGFSLKEVGEWLGHRDIGTTANIYAHLQYKEKVAMGEKVTEALKLGNF